MSKNIYQRGPSKELTAKIRESATWSEFTYKDDPDYQAFRIAITEEVERQDIRRKSKDGELDAVRHNKLYAVWYVASSFRNHWLHPTARSENDMLWTLYHRDWTKNQGIVAVIAWWRTHHRKITNSMLVQLKGLADRVWNEVYQKNMRAKNEREQNSLRNRILFLLEQHPMTTAHLAQRLSATSKAVDSHLYRLRNAGLVERVSWGVYGLKKETYSPPSSGAIAASPDSEESQMASGISERRPALASLSDIDDGIAQPKALQSLDFRELASYGPRELAWSDPDMPTAEPRWSR